MSKSNRIILDVQSGFQFSALFLAFFFLIGAFIGCVVSGFVDDEGATALANFLSDFLSLTALNGMSADFGAVLWGQLRFPLICFLLCFTGVGLIGLPLLFAVRGFFLTFSVACFCRFLGFSGFLPAFFLFALPALAWGPAFFILGGQAFSAAVTLVRRNLGDAKILLPFDATYFARCGCSLCLFLFAAALEYFIVPILLPAATRVVF